MLRVYHSNRLDVLEALMEFIVERERLDDPFEPEMILVQSTGMAQWLQMTLSQKFGIAANIDFPLPASFIWDMFVRVLPEIPKESAFNKQSMSWKLMTLLPQLLDREDFTLLRHYLTDDSDKRKLFQLSSKAADLFDQYLVYRPEWLAQWETGHLVEGLGEAQERGSQIIWFPLFCCIQSSAHCLRVPDHEALSDNLRISPAHLRKSSADHIPAGSRF